MITTSTGAKKLESSDNWREIFPNPGTSAAGAHNASVDAQDRIQAEVAPIINGKRCSLGAASGDYVLLRNSTIAGKTDGAYVAAKAIPANTDLDSTYLGSPITGGISNSLNNKLTDLFQIKSYTYEYTINAESTLVIYGSDFGFSTPSGYYPVACIAFDTDDQRVYSYLVDVHVVNNTAMKLHNIGTISTSGTAKITILYMRDLRTQ